MGRQWKRKWVVYGNYTGPGNPISADYVRSNPPIDALDRASYRHDVAYHRLGKRAYWRGSDADKRFIRDVSASRPSSLKGRVVRLAALGFFKAKNAISDALVRPLTSKDEMPRSRSVSRGRPLLRLGARLRSNSASPRRSRSSSRAMTVSTVVGAAGRSVGTGAHGTYMGKFKRPKTVRPAGKFAMYGFRAHRELFGTQTQNDCAYIGISSMVPQDIGRAVGAALWRKILARRGIVISSPTEPLGLPGGIVTADPLPFRVTWIQKSQNTSGVITYNTGVYSQVPVAGDTLVSLAEAWCQNVFLSAEFNGQADSTAGQKILYAYRVDEKDTNGSTTTGIARLGAVIPIDRQRVTVYSLAKMAIQNVTVADGITGDPLQDDRIDRNPIKGAIFKFSVPTPRLNDDAGTFGQAAADGGNKLQFDTNMDGLIIPNASLTGKWKQVPDPSMFQKCVGRASVSLEPGSIRDISIKFKFSGLLTRLMQGVNNHGTGTPFMRYTFGDNQFGTSMLFALEKRMMTGGLGVSLNYTYNMHYGAVMGRRVKVPLDPFQTGGDAAVADVVT